MLRERCVLTCTEEAAPGYESRRIDRDFLSEHVDDFSQHFYVCGPPDFNESVTAALHDLGASPDLLVFEGWAWERQHDGQGTIPLRTGILAPQLVQK